MAFYLSLEKKLADGSYVSIYPDLLQAYADGRAPKPNLHGNPRCENIVRYEMLKKLATLSPSPRSIRRIHAMVYQAGPR
mgnify:CR=1 FL=1